jgi:hypothetical protein
LCCQILLKSAAIPRALIRASSIIPRTIGIGCNFSTSSPANSAGGGYTFGKPVYLLLVLIRRCGLHLIFFIPITELSETQRELQDLARKFSREEISPRAKEYDESMKFPWDIHKKAWDLGLLNGFVPEKYGGNGLSLFEDCLVIEEFAHGCSGIFNAIHTNDLAVI